MTTITEVVCALVGCDNPVVGRRSSRYCSPEHAKKGWNASRTPEREPEWRQCEHCGTPFPTLKPHQKYCNRRCGDLGDRAKRKGDVFSGLAEEEGRTEYVRGRPDGYPLVSISDLHIPFHDTVTLDAVFRFLDDFIGQEEGDMVLNGDVSDAHSISSFDKNPQRRLQFRDEVDQMRSWLVKLRRRYPSAHIWYLGGNHEARWRQYLWSQAPELSGLAGLSIPELYEVGKLNIPYYPYHSVLDHHGFAITHGNWVRQASGATAKAHYEKLGGSGVCGHCHRRGSHSHNSMKGSHTWFEQGHLALQRQEYNKGQLPDWQQGFFYARIYGSEVYPNLVTILPKGFTAEGKHYGR